MSKSDIKTDQDGIPILEDIIDPEEQDDILSTTDLDKLDRAIVRRLLKDETVDQLLDDMTDDLQSLVNWKIQEFLKEEIQTILQEAAKRSAPKLAQDIRNQLRMALPDLLIEAIRRARSES